jgi:hypothetical protein
MQHRRRAVQVVPLKPSTEATNQQTFCERVYGPNGGRLGDLPCNYNEYSEESWSSYDLTTPEELEEARRIERGEIEFDAQNLVSPWLRTGATTFFAHVTPYVYHGGGEGLAACLETKERDLQQALTDQFHRSTRPVEAWEQNQDGPVVTRIVQNLYNAIMDLARNNPNGPITLVIMSHATRKQTQACFDVVFRKLLPMIRKNLPKGGRAGDIFSRLTVIVEGGHGHKLVNKEMIFNAPGRKIVARYIASRLFAPEMQALGLRT